MNELELLSRYAAVEPVDPALIDATVEAIVRSPDSLARARHRSSPSRRHRASRLVLVGASAAAAVAAATVVVNGLGGSSAPRPAPVARSPGNVLTTYVVQHSLAALETTSGYVERVVQHDSHTIHMSWRGPTQLLDEFPGHSATLWTWAAPGVDTVLRIDYVHNTWSKSVFPAPQPPPDPIGGPRPPGAYMFSQKTVNGPEAQATSIAALFRQPGLEVVGTATIGGARTYELRIPALGPHGKPVIGKGLTAWVNTRTYLPVRVAEDTPVGLPAWTQDFTWEPATPQAIAVFDLTPPAHFRQVNEPTLQPVPPGR
jgi:hypothetical protein